MPVKVVSYRERMKYPEHIVLNTTSRSTDFCKALSPFFLGPVSLYGEFTAKNVENAWQYSKVYPEHVYPDGTVSTSYMTWAINGWNQTRAERYPMGKGAKPLFSLWNGERLDYIEARKKIYAPLYGKAALNTKEFAILLQWYEEGKNIALVDFDGYDYSSLGMTLHDVANDPTRKMGHAFVLAMLLEYPKLREKYLQSHVKQ